jgi:23S rRNA (cytidine1920-2'-O)/16S rRNA (cytidine1409-2'-O)-methyltransferase
VEATELFVSRAGRKLEAALDEFDIDVVETDCLDAGASTGGFTDALLCKGARRVVAVEVGRDQISARLRKDRRVELLENTNVRYLEGWDLPLSPELAVADLSFIPLHVALEGLFRSTPSIREAVLLVKPQFEVGPERVRKGVVREKQAHTQAVSGVIDSFGALGFGAVAVARSPVVGRSGNREYLLHLRRGATSSPLEDRIREVVSP